MHSIYLASSSDSSSFRPTAFFAFDVEFVFEAATDETAAVVLGVIAFFSALVIFFVFVAPVVIFFARFLAALAAGVFFCSIFSPVTGRFAGDFLVLVPALQKFPLQRPEQLRLRPKIL